MHTYVIIVTSLTYFEKKFYIFRIYSDLVFGCHSISNVIFCLLNFASDAWAVPRVLTVFYLYSNELLFFGHCNSIPSLNVAKCRGSRKILYFKEMITWLFLETVYPQVRRRLPLSFV